MILNPNHISQRNKLILAGLFLSRFDRRALQVLGFKGFTEAYNVIGYALGAKPASVKNYRDEFDPLFPNGRSGWHKRSTRDYCLKIFDDYKGLDFDLFASLIRSIAGFDENIWSGTQGDKDSGDGNPSSFARRLITGIAAEQYFESAHSSVPEFKDRSLENTTQLGCGYDYRLRGGSDTDFLVVEVKGLRGATGGLSLTPKEYETAEIMRDRFFLFVVKDFQRSPVHEVFQDPLSSRLRFRRLEKVILQVAWATGI